MHYIKKQHLAKYLHGSNPNYLSRTEELNNGDLILFLGGPAKEIVVHLDDTLQEIYTSPTALYNRILISKAIFTERTSFCNNFIVEVFDKELNILPYNYMAMSFDNNIVCYNKSALKARQSLKFRMYASLRSEVI